MRVALAASFCLSVLAPLPAAADFPCTAALPADVDAAVAGAQCKEHPRDVEWLAALPGNHRIVYPSDWLDSAHRYSHVGLIRATYEDTLYHIEGWRRDADWAPIRASTVFLGVDQFFDLEAPARTLLDRHDPLPTRAGA